MKLKDVPVKKIITEYKAGYGSYSIAKHLGYSKSFILKILKENSIERRYGVTAHNKTRLYKINLDFFKEIISEEQAYFLGLFCSDGCNHGNVAEISLQVEDKFVLEKLSKIIFKNKRPLIKIKARTSITKKGPIKIGEGRRLSICSREVCNLLSDRGIEKRKTWSLNFPSIPEKLTGHFLRGYFDGDGGLSLTRRKNRFVVSFSMIGTWDICKNIQKIFSSLKIHTGIIHRIKDPKEVYCLYCSGCRQIIKILDFLYKNSTIHISRKFLLYKKLRKLRSLRYLYDLFEAINPEGIKFTRFNATQFAKKRGLRPASVLECIRNDRRKSHKGWTFIKILNKIVVNETELVDATPRKNHEL